MEIEAEIEREEEVHSHQNVLDKAINHKKSAPRAMVVIIQWYQYRDGNIPDQTKRMVFEEPQCQSRC